MIFFFLNSTVILTFTSAKSVIHYFSQLPHKIYLFTHVCNKYLLGTHHTLGTDDTEANKKEHKIPAFMELGV